MRQTLRTWGPLITLFLLVAIAGGYDSRFFAPSTLLILVSDTMTLFIMAAGCTFVILMGGIDLSIQAVASLTSVILAIHLPQFGYLAIPLALAGGLAAAARCGGRAGDAISRAHRAIPGCRGCSLSRAPRSPARREGI